MAAMNQASAAKRAQQKEKVAAMNQAKVAASPIAKLAVPRAPAFGKGMLVSVAFKSTMLEAKITSNGMAKGSGFVYNIRYMSRFKSNGTQLVETGVHEARIELRHRNASGGALRTRV